jgi:hypothetical protein
VYAGGVPHDETSRAERAEGSADFAPGVGRGIGSRPNADTNPQEDTQGRRKAQVSPATYV